MTVALYQGDALDVLRALPADSVGGVVTDPPYSSGGMHRGDRVTGSATAKYISSENVHRYEDFSGDARDQRAWIAWCTLWLTQVTEPGGALACFVDWRQLPALTDAVQMAGWVWRGVLVWDKTEACRPVLGRPRAQCEYLVWGSKGPMSIDRDAPVLPGCIRCPVPHDKVHPTEKPVAMLRQVVQIVERGKTVLDPFAGSGAHGVAAIHEGRGFIGSEMTEHYASVARTRLLDALASTHAHDTAVLDALEASGEDLGPRQIAMWSLR